MTLTTFHLPYNFKPYKHQKIVINAFREKNDKGEKKYRQYVNVWHRRAGKDTTWFNLNVESAFERVGYYLYLLPTIGQARDVIWEGIGRDGKKFLDFIPPELIESVNNTTMKIKFVNGSILGFGGTDNYNVHVGTNPVGITFSEYSLQNPNAWDLLSPILAENKGWVAFVYTFRGNNHGYELYEQNKNNPACFTTYYTVDDTVRENNEPIVSSEEIQRLRDNGRPETKIQQEFYNIPVSMEGSYWGAEIMKAEKENRITDFPIDRQIPAYTYWDFGWSDSTAYWIVQLIQNEYRCIGYYENNFSDLMHFINKLHDFRDQHGIVYRGHFAPWDAGVVDMSTGKSKQMNARELGLNFEIISKCNNKDLVIEEIANIFNRIYIHKTNCKQGIRCLKEYHAIYNERLNVYGKPCHNWASHGADAFMGIAQMDKKLSKRYNMPGFIGKVNQGNLFR